MPHIPLWPIITLDSFGDHLLQSKPSWVYYIRKPFWVCALETMGSMFATIYRGPVSWLRKQKDLTLCQLELTLCNVTSNSVPAELANRLKRRKIFILRSCENIICFNPLKPQIQNLKFVPNPLSSFVMMFEGVCVLESISVKKYKVDFQIH